MIKCTLINTFLAAQAFQLLLHLPIVYHKHKVDGRCQHGQYKGQQGDSGVNKTLEPTSAAGSIWIVSILFAYEVAEEFRLQSVRSLLGQREVYKCHHLEEDVVTEDNE